VPVRFIFHYLKAFGFEGVYIKIRQGDSVLGCITSMLPQFVMKIKQSWLILKKVTNYQKRLYKSTDADFIVVRRINLKHFSILYLFDEIT
jgi:hypothetical protein